MFIGVVLEGLAVYLHVYCGTGLWTVYTQQLWSSQQELVRLQERKEEVKYYVHENNVAMNK